jgi:Ser/Thr protein kinase RdoA (MazF antagonist)
LIAFDQLTYRGQFRRLRSLALQALKSYHWGDFCLEAIQHRENATFRLRVDNGQRYLLRVIRPGYKDPAVVQSEMIWLNAIVQETDLAVPEPIVNLYGNLLTFASVPGVPQPRICTLYRWIEGRFCGQAKLTRSHLEKVGRLTGKLHNHAQGFTPPPQFTRIRWDYDGLFEGGQGGTLAMARSLLDTQRQEIMAQAITRVQLAMRSLQETRSVWGLIHADLNQLNYVFSKGEAQAIDFDDCGWGYYLYDISTSLGPLVSRGDFLDLRTAFLKGYRSVRPLSSEDEALLIDFLLADRLRLAVWMAGRQDNPGLRDRAAKFTQDRIDQITVMMN